MHFLIVGAVVIISSLSCGKSYSCSCTAGATGLSTDWEDLTKEQAKGAEKDCEASHKIALFTNDSCSFKNN